MYKKQILILLIILSFSAYFSCSVIEYSNSELWALNTLKHLTIEEKIGQMITVSFSGTFINENDNNFLRRVKFQIDRNKVGGFIIYGGNVTDIAGLLNYMQSLSKIPLLIASDLETGLGQQVRDAVEFPNMMALGAARSEELAYQMGKITALEARAVGIHQTYSPVVDVNSNPFNPIINIRSISEDPELVSRLASAYIRGCQENGLIATAKHFPGHGDTDTDSHSGLPVINADIKKFENIDLKPFKTAVEAGVKSIMTAHIKVPALQDNIPATLSSKILTGLLRKQYGFDGLIVTDALEMKGITDNYSAVDAAIKAVNAGADIILVPPETELAFDALLTAWRNNKITESRIDSSVYRILRTKAEMGLHITAMVNLNNLRSFVSKPEHIEISEKIAEKSLTLLKDENNLIPLDYRRYKKVLALVINDENNNEGGHFLEMLSRNMDNIENALIDMRTNNEEFRNVIEQVRQSDLIILGAFIPLKAEKGTIALDNKLVRYIKEIYRLNKSVILISFSSPYLLMQIPEASTYFCAYSNSQYSQEAAALGISGYIDITGRLPVTIPDFYAIGSGIERNGINKELYSKNLKIRHFLQTDRPENLDFLGGLSDTLDSIISDAAKNKVTPGCQLLVSRRGKVIYSQSYGRTSYNPDAEEINEDHVYDLASLTKVVVTSTLSMIFLDRGLIKLDDPVYKYIKDFRGPDKNRIKIFHLLTHSSGLPAWKPLYEEVTSKDDMYNRIKRMSLEYSPGDRTVYSCLGMILLGNILEKVGGKSLDELAEEHIFDPLDMTKTMYNAGNRLGELCVPTELDDYWRYRLVTGEVHDENASSMGGVSANAGLFSNADDLSKFCQMLLNRGVYNYKRLIKEQTIEMFTKRFNLVFGSSRGIGWDTPSYPSSSGDYFSDFSYGHTGFTGTSIWIDPKRELFAILLTNRVHPSRNNDKIFELRRQVHNTIIEYMVK
ncbi:glycoside hydrolase family 3 N-terminal domain-containing protein [candidate division KSB1 bacterium]